MSPRLRVLPLLVLLSIAACDDGPPAVNPKDHAEGLYLKGTAEYLQGQFEASLASFEAMKQLTPNDPRLPAARGEVFLSMGRINDALTEFEAAIKLDPKRSTNWSRLGFIQAQLGKVPEAQSSLRKAIALYPNDFNALESLGELHLKKGEKDEAVRHFSLAAGAASGEAKSMLVMRAVDVLNQQGKNDEVIKLTDNAVGQGVRAPEVLSALGDALVRAGRLTEALEAYKDAASQSRTDPTLWELVGEIHLRLDKPADAIAAYKESLKIKNRAVVHVALARIHLARQDRPGALDELNAALESVSGKDLREMRELADLLATLDRKPDALKILASLSAEQENVKDTELQLTTARLAKELKDAALQQVACARVTAADAGVTKCP
ncbi:tetratricopeptide repeat protein [Pyxidicoccus parkwayensis]|jgi:tetratricopeptide (TPR) repeat protein|uniref:Tetratricopeptide repeat protein n=1 Tax=Pyxidicoccus parkwayensis TaxID=2813578 RepID=A0ABX7P472_9BACT|nr:tetratricopeptide repeat protein [Pyxidicoccus parkwaysis]QSQ25226.1 tetratricopeptide repeat protein [Pyxidicoccus parkwaysis]